MSTGSAFDGAVFASYTKAIVVTINYRLGPFGKEIERTDHHYIF
jgi:carboxylesterase type B